MSNYFAIATVTAAISYLLEGIKTDVPGTEISVKPPDAIADPTNLKNRLNIFLYQVNPNVGYSNVDLPTRNFNGELVKSPKLALNLHYLLTAYSYDNDELFVQQILARAMTILNENPILTRKTIRDAIDAQENKIGKSDLADQVELVKLNFQHISLEEITKLWSSFFHQTNYRISVAYQATVILLDSKQQPKPTLPVQSRVLYVDPFKQPIIDKIEPQMVRATSDTKIAITGRNLKTNKVIVKFGSVTKAVESKEDITDNRILIKVPDKLDAGIIQVQVIHPLILGSQSAEHDGGFESNVASFVLSPMIITESPIEVSRGDDLSLNIEPVVASRQRVDILIGDYTFSVPPESLGQPANSLTIKIPNNFPTGTFLLRIRIDGAESFLDLDNNNEFIGPSITVKNPT
jgi:hypothetical protein